MNAGAVCVGGCKGNMMLRPEKRELVLIAAIASLVLLTALVPAGVAAPEILFQDDFETNLLNWTVSGVSRTSTTAYSGTYSAYFNNVNEEIYTTIDTGCYYNLTLSFARTTESLETGNYLRVQVRPAGSGNWITIASYSDNLDWGMSTFSIPAFPGDLQIRFWLDSDSSYDYAWVDTVTVTGEPKNCSAGGDGDVDIYHLMDASGSMDDNEYNLQKDGLIDAIGNASIVPRDGTVSICIIQFSYYPAVSLPLTRVTDDTIDYILWTIDNFTRTGLGTRTNLSGAIDTAVYYATVCCPDNHSDRLVLDASSDGVENEGRPSEDARDDAIPPSGPFEVVNTLGIGNQINATLLQNLAYPQPYDDTKGFYIYASSFEEFDEAIATKLLTELGTSIGDFVWYDCNETNLIYNGQQDPGEPGVPNVTVNLYNATDDSLVNSTLTDQDGYYNFTEVEPGVYYLQFVLPLSLSSFNWTLKDWDAVPDNLDSDVNSTGFTENFTLASKENNLDMDAGIWAEPCEPIPEAGTVVLFSVGLLTLTGYVVVRRRRERR